MTTAAAPTPLTAEHLDRAARDVAGDSLSDFVLRMDRRQSPGSATSRVCPTLVKGKNAGHGALGVTGDGQWLICGKCEQREGISRGEIEQLEQQEREHDERLRLSALESANTTSAN